MNEKESDMGEKESSGAGGAIAGVDGVGAWFLA